MTEVQTSTPARSRSWNRGQSRIEFKRFALSALYETRSAVRLPASVGRNTSWLFVGRVALTSGLSLSLRS